MTPGIFQHYFAKQCVLLISHQTRFHQVAIHQGQLGLVKAGHVLEAATEVGKRPIQVTREEDHVLSVAELLHDDGLRRCRHVRLYGDDPVGSGQQQGHPLQRLRRYPLRERKKKKKERMEKVILTTSQLNQLAFHHPTLAVSFYGTVPCDGMPSNPDTSRPQGYIVNTDPAGQPGQHWLGVWTTEKSCEVFDSFALDLNTYGTTAPLKTWLSLVRQTGQRRVPEN